jgi:GTPase SAR1 family protein
MDFCSLKPTSSYNIQTFDERGVKFSLWDFGGQEKFRKEYLENLDEYLAETDKIIFVVDIQDSKRYDLALTYLKQIINYVIKNELDINFSIFLHKFDPNLEKKPDFQEKKLSTTLYDQLKKIIPPDFAYHIFKTSIYTVFQKRPLNL